MDGIFYASAIAGLTVLATFAPSLDKWCAALIGIVLVIFSGLRTGGFDHEEYLTMVSALRASSNIGALEFMAAAKDPLFGLLVWSAEQLKTNDAWVLLVMSATAGLTKVAFAWTFRGGATLFLALYALLLAPGLEFAALRASVGIGFLLLAVVSRKSRRPVFAVLGVLSHLSLFVTTAFAFWRTRLTVRNVTIAAFVVVVGTYAATSGFMGLFPAVQRLEEYRTNRGTGFALLVPLSTLGLLWVGARMNVLNAEIVIDPSIGKAYQIAVGMAAVALGVALPMVTVSTRVLEVSWAFALFVFARLATARASTRARIGIVAFVAMMAVVNIERGTWAAMMNLGILSNW